MTGQLENTGSRRSTTVLPGTMVAHYRVIRQLGAGGMGEVYLAEDTQLSRQVALKFLSPLLSASEEFRRRFIREAQAAARLDHPNVVTVYQVGEHEQRPFFSMQHIEGPSLREYCRARALGIGELLELAVQVCDGLGAAHAQGIIHRDVKPDNILIDAEGRARLVDFGLAALTQSELVTTAAAPLGTAAYMSPEQLRGETVDARSDLWSFGVVLWEMLTGELPFRGQYDQAITYAILNEPLEPSLRKQPSMPAQLTKLLDRLLAKDPGARYPDARRLVTELRSVRDNLQPMTPLGHRWAGRATPSIAVLSFRDMSPDTDQEYFCEGMAEELINVLTRVDGLHVCARTSAFQFKGRDCDIRSIGEQLGVQTILEGSVRKSGNRLRVSTQLVNAADGYHLWAERFDRDLDDVFTIQDEISTAVVTKLKSTLLDSDRHCLTRRHTENHEAYQLYLRGRYYWNRRYEGELKRALECFQQSIALDPQYAPGYTGLADCYVILSQYGWARPRDGFALARTAAEQALALDPEFSDAYATLGWIRFFHDWDPNGAVEAFRKAIDLNPSNVSAHQWYAVILGPMQRFDDGWAELDTARALDPLSITIHAITGLGLYYCRRYDEAIQHLEKTLEMDATYQMSLLFLGWTLGACRRWADSIAVLQRLLGLPTPNPFALGSQGLFQALAGNHTEARAALLRLNDMGNQMYVSPFYEALVYAGLGDRDQAFTRLEAAIEEREPFLATLATFPLVDSLRDDSRFGEFVKRITA